MSLRIGVRHGPACGRIDSLSSPVHIDRARALVAVRFHYADARLPAILTRDRLTRRCTERLGHVWESDPWSRSVP